MANLSNINNKFIVADVATATRVSIGITTTNNLLTLFGTGAGNATLQIEGEGGADPYINFLANNAQHWSLGIDDSDSDKFKLSEHSALGTNDYFVVDTSGKVGIGTDSPSAKLEVKAADTGSTTDYATKVIKAVAPLVGGYTGTKIISLLGGFDGAIYAVDFGYGYNTNGYDMMLSTNDNTSGNPIERMRIDSSGNVGINDTNPNTANLSIKGQSTGVSANYPMLKLLGQNTSSDGLHITTTGTGNNYYAIKVATGADSSAFAVTNAGNVGIGTDDPDYPLHVKNSSTSYLFSETTGPGAAAGFRWKTPDSEFSWYSAGGLNNMNLYDYTASAVRMTIDSDGNAIFTKNVTVGTAAASDFVLALRGGVGGFFGWDDSANKTILQAPNTRKLSLRVNSDTFGAGTEAILIDSSGNVGIGVNASDYWANASNLVVGGLGAVSGITIATDGNLTGSLIFADGTGGGDNTRGGLQYDHSTNNMLFRVNNDTKMRIDSNGSIGMGANNVNYRLRVKSDATVDNGIYLSAGSSSANHILYVENQDSSAEYFAVRGDGEIRLNATSGHTFANTGIRFGTNASANNLDDYEEGTWDPQIAMSASTISASYLYKLGTYTKIGRMVMAMFDLTATVSGTISGFAKIINLPFTVGSTAPGGAMAGYSVTQWRSSSLFNAASAEQQIKGFAQQSNAYIYCQLDGSGTIGFSGGAGATWKTGVAGRATGYVMYFVD